MEIKATEAAVLVQPGEPLELIELEIPDLRPGQVLVEVAYSGICHTQLSEVRGLRGPDKFLPHTLGHEGSGIVLQAGPGVEKVQPGDRVVLSWLKGSGAEVSGQKYASVVGEVNSGAISTFMRHTVTCENRVTPIPDEMPLREAALLGCAVLTGAGAVFNSAGLQQGASLAVFGAGGIGLAAILAARVAKAAQIIAVDIHDSKLAQAQSLGATTILNARTGNPVEKIRDLSGGPGVDCAIEAAGVAETMEQAFDAVRRQGGKCILAGNLPFGQRIQIDPFELVCGKQITGTWGGESRPDRDIPRYVDLFLSGTFPVDQLLTHEFALEDINVALEMLEAGQLGRGLLEL